MTLFLDTSALLALSVDGPQRAVVTTALTESLGAPPDNTPANTGGDTAGATGRILATDAAPVWAASALALTEALPAIDRLTDEPIIRLDLEDSIRLAWDHLHVVPVDQRCLDRAAALARTQPVRLTDAIHFAAAERLPRPLRFVTFDPAQIGVAIGLGFDVVST